MQIAFAVGFSLLCNVAAGIPAHASAPHESIRGTPRGWRKLGLADSSSAITLNIALPIPDDLFTEAAEEVSDPANLRYGQYLSATELASLVPSTSQASEVVESWLKNSSIAFNTLTRDSNTITFSTTVGMVSKLLNAQFYEYEREAPQSNRHRKRATVEKIVRTTTYSIPSEMSRYVDFIYPTIHFFAHQTTEKHETRLRTRQLPPAGPLNCSNTNCPDALTKRYNIDYYPADGTSGNTFAVTAFIDNYPNITAWHDFLRKYSIHPSRPLPKYQILSVANGTTTTPPPALANLQVEPQLDLEYTTGFTGAIPLQFISTGGFATELDQPGNVSNPHPGNEPYLQFMQYILSQPKPPPVISISYSDDEQSVPEKYARRVCALFAQAAARGISIIDSSGDGGAAGTLEQENQCRGPNNHHTFIPSFPATCPWVTAVGATDQSGSAASYSGGGFSRYFARPAWQESQVEQYVSELTGALSRANNSRSDLYSSTGRGMPDVSLLGDDYFVPTAGIPIKGTSASTPVFAAMVVLLNDLRLRAGKPVLGFLNPLLYAMQRESVYRDVADGSNSDGCADVSASFFQPGWPALKGWDAVTGLGEPDFAKLRKSLQL